MAGRRDFGRRRKKVKRQKPQPQDLYILDQFTLEDILRRKIIAEKYVEYWWVHYTSLEFQRWEIQEALKTALVNASTGPYSFSRWQRAVKFKYATNPLSAKGSLTMPGGRFNFGDIDDRFPRFPALYVTEDRETAMEELLGNTPDPATELSAEDYALARSGSIAIASVSGKLETVIDLTQPACLSEFVGHIKTFEISDDVIKLARELKLERPVVVQSVDQIIGTLMIPDWRAYPIQFDIPANSQIFGKLVKSAGIEGILYPSKHTGKKCLAIFVENFSSSESFVSLDDDPPPETLIRKVDATNWNQIC